MQQQQNTRSKRTIIHSNKSKRKSKKNLQSIRPRNEEEDTFNKFTPPDFTFQIFCYYQKHSNRTGDHRCDMTIPCIE